MTSAKYRSSDPSANHTRALRRMDTRAKEAKESASFTTSGLMNLCLFLTTGCAKAANDMVSM
jgi:hypothetical protein